MPGTSLSLPVADKLSIWPVEGGRFGVDATFTGASGYARAQHHERALMAAHAQYSFRQELGGAWTIRLGPLAPADVAMAVDSFVSAGL